MFHAIPQIARGLQFGLELSQAKRFEDTVRAGGNRHLTIGYQIAQLETVLNLVDRVCKAASLSCFSWKGKSIIFLTPSLLAAFNDATTIPQGMHPILTFSQNHLSSLCQVAAIVSSLSLLSFGQTCLATPCLFALGIGFMDRNGWLPLAGRQFLHQYAPLLTIATGLVFGGIIRRTFVMIDIFLWCADKFWSAKNVAVSTPVAAEGSDDESAVTGASSQKMQRESFTLQQTLTARKACQYLRGELDIEVNKQSIHYDPFPPIPNTDIQFLVTQFDQIDWQQHIRILRRKFEDDHRRFLQKYGSSVQDTEDQKLIEIARESLRELILEIKQCQMRRGEPDYEKLHAYFKLIAKYIQDTIQTDDAEHSREREITRVDIILRLAIEGRGLCGSGIFEIVEEIFPQLLLDNKGISFEDKIIYCLQCARNQWMQGWYEEICQTTQLGRIIGWFIDWRDVHNYNKFISFYGAQFGVRSGAADNDDTVAMIDPLFKWLMSQLGTNMMLPVFWAEYNLEKHIEVLRDSIGTAHIAEYEFFVFWSNWIERQDLSPRDREALQEELMTERLFGESFRDDAGKISSKFITLMLLDMGIVVERSPSLSRHPAGAGAERTSILARKPNGPPRRRVSRN
jgi:hypothetical protein